MTNVTRLQPNRSEPTNLGLVTRAGDHALPLDDCPCSHCRRARRRASSDLPLNPALLEDPDDRAQNIRDLIGVVIVLAALAATIATIVVLASWAVLEVVL